MNQPARKQAPQSDRISGTVETIRGPYGPRNDWYIATLEDGRTVTGNLPATLRAGDCCEFHGTPEFNAKYGEQFKARSCVLSTPTGDKAVTAYLRKFDGIGPVMAARIVETFGGDGALAAMDAGDAAKLATVRGISRTKAGVMIERYRAIRATRERDMLFAEAGITDKAMARLVLRFGRKARVFEVLKENPYKLVEADGIGFLKADAIAQRIGIEPENKYRIRTGLAYTLLEKEREGHTFLTRPQLAAAGQKILGVGRGLIEAQISGAVEGGSVVEENGRIYHADLYAAEARTAAILCGMMRRPFQVRMAALEPGRFEALDPDQQRAFRTAASSRAMVVTGGPGTGKCVVEGTLVAGRDGHLFPIEALSPIPELNLNAEDRSVEYKNRPFVQTRHGVKRASHFFFGGVKETFELVTRDGYRLSGTGNHRVIVATPSGPDWKKLSDVGEEDYVAIFREDLTPSKNTFSGIAYLMGLFSGDGGRIKGHNGAYISNPEPEIHEFLDAFFSDRGFNLTTLNKSGVELKGDCPNLYIPAVVVREMKALGELFRLSIHKTVPSGILSGTMDEKRSYLSGLFDTDGSSYGPDGRIELGLSSFEMLQSVQTMLLQFGIVSSLKRRGNTHHWRLFITGENAKKFYMDIGFRVCRKQAGSKMMAKKRNANRDVVPCLGGGLLRGFIAKTGPHERKWWWKWKRECSGERLPTRSRVLGLLSEHPGVNGKEAEAIKSLCDGNIYWSRVEWINRGTGRVFDLTVPGEEEFVANGFVNHNTHTIRTIIEGVRSYAGDGKRREVLLAAPTGKAANRMKEATGMDAKTIHRLLEFSPEIDGFKRDERNPLDVDTLVVDEFSMVDIRLAASLLRAVPEDAQVIFVGDKDQLPSVGPGRVLADIIASRKIPVVELTHLHRQGAGSGIDRAAKLVNAGGALPLGHIQGAGFVFPDVEDLVFHRCESADAIPGLIVRYSRQIMEKRGFAASDIMTLCPQRVKSIGSNALNPILRDEIHNPDGAPIFKTGFRVGDRVIQLKNDYDLEIFNGDLGIIRVMGPDSLIVDFDGGEDGSRRVRYPLESLDCLALAYALTVHKSQGSEYPVVVMPVHESNSFMLKRGLLYTGLTRGKKLVVLVGTEKAVKHAIRSVDGGGRNSALAERIERGAA